MAFITSELWPSMKSSLKAPWRNLRQYSPPAVVSIPQGLAGQRPKSIEDPGAKTNVRHIDLPLAGIVLTLTVCFSAGATRLLSISAHRYSQTSARKRGHPHRPALNDGNHPYVVSILLKQIFAYRHSFFKDPSTRKSNLLENSIHVKNYTTLHDITTLSIHTRLQTYKI